MTNAFTKKLLAIGTKNLLLGAALVIGTAGTLGVAAETGALTAGPSPSPTAQSAGAQDSASASALPDANAGGKNVVQVVNRSDGKFRVDGKVQLNTIPAPNAGPVNLALAYSQCTNCQTLALALQINLISTHASNVQPKNAATAVNVQCNGCLTVARAIQYNISVDDPNNVSPSVRRLVAQMKSELAQIKTSSKSLSEAESRFEAVIAQFQDLAGYLKDSRDVQTAPTTPGATPLASSVPETDTSPPPSPTATVESSPTPSASP
jgi:putative peptide zinc metalloprotease protein